MIFLDPGWFAGSTQATWDKGVRGTTEEGWWGLCGVVQDLQGHILIGLLLDLDH